MTVLITFATNKPVVSALCLTSNSDIVAWFCLDILWIVPIYCHIFNELEGIAILFVVLGQVCCHLKWAIHHKIKSQLACQCSVNIRLIATPILQLCFENTRRIVHRSTLKSCEWQYNCMVGVASTECFILCTSCTFVTYKVRICTAKSCWSGCFMCVNHNLMLSCFGHSV